MLRSRPNTFTYCAISDGRLMRMRAVTSSTDTILSSYTWNVGVLDPARLGAVPAAPTTELGNREPRRLTEMAQPCGDGLPRGPRASWDVR